jgi:hypothetical protein
MVLREQLEQLEHRGQQEGPRDLLVHKELLERLDHRE